MVATVDERLTSLEARVDKVEATLNGVKRPRFAVTVEEARARLLEPAQRSPETIERFRRIYGRFDGPADLSERMRDYLNGDRE